MSDLPTTCVQALEMVAKAVRSAAITGVSYAAQGVSYLGAVRQAYRDARVEPMGFYESRFGRLEEGGEALEPAAQCACWWVDPKLWTTHYGAAEPGSQMEWNPECPVHPPAPYSPADFGPCECVCRLCIQGDHCDAPSCATLPDWEADLLREASVPAAGVVPTPNPPSPSFTALPAPKPRVDGEGPNGASDIPPSPPLGHPTSEDLIAFAAEMISSHRLRDRSGFGGLECKCGDRLVGCNALLEYDHHLAELLIPAVLQRVGGVGVTPTPKPAGTGEK